MARSYSESVSTVFPCNKQETVGPCENRGTESTCSRFRNACMVWQYIWAWRWLARQIFFYWMVCVSYLLVSTKDYSQKAKTRFCLRNRTQELMVATAFVVFDTLPIIYSRSQNWTCMRKQRAILSRWKSSALVMSASSVLQVLEWEPLSWVCEEVPVAQDVTNVLPLVLFYVLMTRFTKKLAYLSLKLVDAQCRKAPTQNRKLASHSDRWSTKGEITEVS